MPGAGACPGPPRSRSGATRKRAICAAPSQPSGSDPELVRVELPAGARVDYPASTYLSWKHVIWVLEGELLFHEGAARHRLAAGDCLVLGAPADCGFENASEQPCGYLVVLSRR